ncbi:helix-turn-helix domain-containing protein [Streptomyces sp. TE33382]
MELTPREERVLQCTAEAMNRHTVAGELSISVSTVTGYLASLRQKLGVRSSSLRPLLCAAYAHRVVAAPLRLGVRAVDGRRARAVWSQLGADVEDDALAQHIAMQLHLGPGPVHEVLEDLRRGKDGWSDVIRIGFERRYLPARQTPPQAAARQHGNPRLRAAARPADVPAHHLFTVLPRPGDTQDTVRYLTDAGGRCVVGEHAQALLIGPGVRDEVLQRVPEERWGPVLGDTDGRRAVLFLPPGTIQGRWPAGGGQLARAGFVYQLPLPGDCGARYWDVPPTGRLWDVRDLLRATGGDRALALADLTPAAGTVEPRRHP